MKLHPAKAGWFLTFRDSYGAESRPKTIHPALPKRTGIIVKGRAGFIHTWFSGCGIKKEELRPQIIPRAMLIFRKSRSKGYCRFPGPA